MRFKKVKDGYLDENCIIWQKKQCEDKFTFDEAIKYCKTLGGGWRLPTANELTSIINYEKSDHASDLPDIMSSNYWSATTLANNTDFAWRVYFSYGHVDDGYKSDTYYVRAVKDFNGKAVEKNEDMVNHPKHYQKVPGIECIDVIEHFNLNSGNVIKYVWRCDEKGKPVEDLKKAKWYLEREIERRAKIEI